jgi:hypothetical protein
VKGEHPILFSAPMVLALLDGRKTQTRRVVKLPPGYQFDGVRARAAVLCSLPRQPTGARVVRCPYGFPGDRLWVRETWAPSQGDERPWCEYRADCADPLAIKWKPGIYMPRRLSRIILEITDVRVQRLHDITEEDARAEGVALSRWRPAALDAFEHLWQQINGDGSWEANPYVWALTFQLLMVVTQVPDAPLRQPPQTSGKNRKNAP